MILKPKVVAENLENENKKKTLISLLSTDNTLINTLVSSLSGSALCLTDRISSILRYDFFFILTSLKLRHVL